MGMTLDEAGFGDSVRVVALDGLDESDRAALDGVGLRPGVGVTKILRAPLRDPIECLVGAQLLAVEKRLLPGIRVEPA